MRGRGVENCLNLRNVIHGRSLNCLKVSLQMRNKQKSHFFRNIKLLIEEFVMFRRALDCRHLKTWCLTLHQLGRCLITLDRKTGNYLRCSNNIRQILIKRMQVLLTFFAMISKCNSNVEIHRNPKITLQTIINLTLFYPGTLKVDPFF